jgi:hypothetical protein
MAATQLDGALRDRRHRSAVEPAKAAAAGSPSASTARTPSSNSECRPPRRNRVDVAAVLLAPEFDSSTTSQRTPAVLGNPTVIAGVGVTHLRYPVRNRPQ